MKWNDRSTVAPEIAHAHLPGNNLKYWHLDKLVTLGRSFLQRPVTITS